MNIKEIRLENFKNIVNSTIIFKNNMSGIYGPNGTGKTAIIEAIQIFKTYFSPRDPNVKISGEYSDFMQSKLSSSIAIGEKNMVIEVTFEKNEKDYKLSVEFEKDEENIFFVSKEIFSTKKSNSRQKFVELGSFDNNKNFLNPIFKIKNKEVGLSKDISEEEIKDYKRIMKNFDFLSSFLMQSICFSGFSYSKLFKDEINFLDFHDALSSIEILLLGIVSITLKNQCSFKDEIIIPFKCIDENKAIRTLNYDENKNLLPEKLADLLINTIKDINSIFSIVIPNSKLIAEKKSSGKNPKGEKFSYVNIYVERDKKKLSITSESTGVIKLASLLSTLILYIKYKNITVIIDELDVHIFEYLLAVLLETLSHLAKGQLIFTGHNLLPMEKLGKDSIIITTKCDILNGTSDNEKNVLYTFMKGVSGSTNLRQKYLRSQVLWSEDNIEPLLLNIPALEVFVESLVLNNEE